jgi:PTS system mannose-specific IIA component
MFGGTPSNLAISLMQEGQVEVISGMNIPMIVKLVRMRKKKLMDAVQQSSESGQHYIMVASQFLGKKNDNKSKNS